MINQFEVEKIKSPILKSGIEAYNYAPKSKLQTLLSDAIVTHNILNHVL